MFTFLAPAFARPDKLNNRYNDPEKSEVRFQIQSGDKPLDLGTIELTTQ